jgi:hypothetical protein
MLCIFDYDLRINNIITFALNIFQIPQLIANFATFIAEIYNADYP